MYGFISTYIQTHHITGCEELVVRKYRVVNKSPEVYRNPFFFVFFSSIHNLYLLYLKL